MSRCRSPRSNKCVGGPLLAAKNYLRNVGDLLKHLSVCIHRPQRNTRYMCTTDPSQCSTETCRCEDPSHIRKAGLPKVGRLQRHALEGLCDIDFFFFQSFLLWIKPGIWICPKHHLFGPCPYSQSSSSKRQEMQTLNRSTCYLWGPNGEEKPFLAEKPSER